MSCHESRGEIGQPICATPSAIGHSLVHNVANQWGCEKTCHLIFGFSLKQQNAYRPIGFLHLKWCLCTTQFFPFLRMFFSYICPSSLLLSAAAFSRWLSLPLPSGKAQGYEITIISKRNFFLYTPLLPTCTMGSIEELSSCYHWACRDRFLHEKR